ncbi:MAG TPA: hypothetical protein VNJ02_12650 [Vicinamibacterales bacterium]|nr:hypothetical protein [Vicinamibacterales bacterium]
MVAALVLTVQVSSAAISDVGCTPADRQAISFNLKMIARGNEAAVDDLADTELRGPSERCTLIHLARAARLGWLAARRVASQGGAPDLLAPVRSSLNELEQLRDDPGVALEVEYAQTAIRAAVAAAQEERGELELLLDHARDLAERLHARGRDAVWPRSFNVLAGELWLEVDRYDQARMAFTRALASAGEPIAAIGLARANVRLGNHSAACDAYRHVKGANDAWELESRRYLSGCP